MGRNSVDEPVALVARQHDVAGVIREARRLHRVPAWSVWGRRDNVRKVPIVPAATRRKVCRQIFAAAGELAAPRRPNSYFVHRPDGNLPGAPGDRRRPVRSTEPILNDRHRGPSDAEACRVHFTGLHRCYGPVQLAASDQGLRCLETLRAKLSSPQQCPSLRRLIATKERRGELIDDNQRLVLAHRRPHAVRQILVDETPNARGHHRTGRLGQAHTRRLIGASTSLPG